MISLKKLLAGAFALALTTAAHALPSATATFVRVTGSTAYRGATNTAITNIFDSGTLTYAYIGTSLSGAGTAIFHGSINSTEVVIETAFTGSVGGIQLVGQGLTTTYFINTYADTPSNLTAGGTALGAFPANSSAAYVPDVTMSDSFQSASLFTPTNTDSRYTAAQMTDTIVGVVPFQWVTSAGSPVTNITPQLANAVFTHPTGAATALFTGNPSDQTTTIFGMGRDADSGTRLCALSETGIGVSTPLHQYTPIISPGTTTITGQTPSAALTIDGIAHAAGDGGFASGGTLATNIGASGSLAAINGYYVAYLSTGDAATAIGLGAKAITYNGVAESTSNIQQGLYTFWSYEHLMYQTALAAATDATSITKVSVANTLAARIHDHDATLLVGTMKVVRTQDGGAVTQNY